MGLATVPTFSANFRDLVLPPSAMIGQENKGWQCVLGGLDNERLYDGAIGVGASQAIIDEVVTYLKQRVQFGKPLSKLHSVRHKIVDMQLRVEAARLLVYRGASVLEKTGACHNEASFAKVAGAECYMHCAYTGLHLLGGYGYTVDSGLPMHFQTPSCSRSAAARWKCNATSSRAAWGCKWHCRTESWRPWRTPPNWRAARPASRSAAGASAAGRWPSRCTGRRTACEFRRMRC